MRPKNFLILKRSKMEWVNMGEGGGGEGWWERKDWGGEGEGRGRKGGEAFLYIGNQ